LVLKVLQSLQTELIANVLTVEFILKFNDNHNHNDNVIHIDIDIHTVSHY